MFHFTIHLDFCRFSVYGAKVTGAYLILVHVSPPYPQLYIKLKLKSNRSSKSV